MTWHWRSDVGWCGGYRWWREFPWLDVGSTAVETRDERGDLVSSSGHRRTLIVYTPLGGAFIAFGRVLAHRPPYWRGPAAREDRHFHAWENEMEDA